jgi:steroid delta-isomerase-like uncharacterized protein
MNKILFLSLPAMALIASCTAPSNPENDKMMAEHKEMMKADSATKATDNANIECFKKVYGMFESGNTEGIEGCVAENVVEHTPPPDVTTTGLQGLKDIIAYHRAAFPDTKFTVLNITAKDGMVYCHFNMKGTNSGPMGKMPATNKAIDVNGVDIVRFENGKAVEHWGYWEDSKFMQQMGMMPPAEGAADAKKKG